MVVNYGVHASLHPYSHHQIVHTSFNLHNTYPAPNPPPPHTHTHTHTHTPIPLPDTSNNGKALDLINWEKPFTHKNINAQVTKVRTN